VWEPVSDNRLASLTAPAGGYLWPRWLFLRALGLIFFSAFYSLAFQIHGLIGERGILPATAYLRAISDAVPGIKRLWYAPSVLWLGSSDRALRGLVLLVEAQGFLGARPGGFRAGDVDVDRELGHVGQDDHTVVADFDETTVHREPLLGAVLELHACGPGCGSHPVSGQPNH